MAPSYGSIYPNNDVKVCRLFVVISIPPGRKSIEVEGRRREYYLSPLTLAPPFVFDDNLIIFYVAAADSVSLPSPPPPKPYHPKSLLVLGSYCLELSASVLLFNSTILSISFVGGNGAGAAWAGGGVTRRHPPTAPMSLPNIVRFSSPSPSTIAH